MTSRRWGNRARVLLTVVVSVSLLTLSGCVFVTPHEELNDPIVNGTTSLNVGAAKLRGLMIVANGSGDVSDGNFILVAVNASSHEVAIRLTYATRSGAQTSQLEIPAHSSVSRGTSVGQQQLLVRDLETRPGGLLSVTVASGGRTGVVDVPVLNGSLPYYATLTPSPSASGGAAPTPLPGD